MTRRSSPIIVGRDRELAEIAAARARAASGVPQVIVVRGEAGIGKSRLVEEAVATARADGEAVLHGACVDFGGDGVPYLPIISAMRGWSRSIGPGDLDALVGANAADLAAVFPDLRPRAEPADQEPPAPGASGTDRARLFERFLDLLSGLAARTPVLSVIEDVQWIDPASRDLLTFLVRNVTTERIVAVLTCRTDDVPGGHPVAAWLAEIGRLPGASRLELGRLQGDDIGRQLEAIVGGSIDPAVVDRIARRSDGHPLFAEELLAADAGEGPPPSLVDILLARVLTLDRATLAVVRTGAVAGRPLDERLLAKIVGQSETDVGEALRVATARGVLVAHPDGTHGFRHELLREVVEREMSAGERRAMHERIARTIEAEVGTDPAEASAADLTAELARHWFAADRPSEAHRASLRAASAAERVNAFAGAGRLLERAIGLEPRLPAEERPDRADQIAVRDRAAVAADLAGDIPRAIELVESAIALTDAGSSPTTVGLLHARLGFLTWASGRGEAALAEHERAVALVPSEPPTAERANVLGGLAGALMGLGRFAESRPLAEAAIACAVAAGSAAEECRGRMTLGSDLVALGEIDAGIEQLRRAHELAPPDRTELIVVTGHNLALNLLAADRLEEALDAATRTREATRAGGLERRYGMELAALVADLWFRLGRWTDADEVTRAGLALDRLGRGSPYLAIVRGRLAANRGALDEARDRLTGIAIVDLDPDVAVIHAVASVEMAVVAGEPTTAADVAAGSLAMFAGTGTEIWSVPLLAHGMRALADLAETARASRDAGGLADLTRAAEALGSFEPAFAESAIGGTSTVVAWLATARAERSRLDAAPDPAPWASAADAWDRAGGGLGAAYARFRLAETELRRAGVKADVGADLRAARRIARELGAGPLAMSVETLARRARVALEDPSAEASDAADREPIGDAGATSTVRSAKAPGAAHTLSDREIEVLRLVAAGRSNGEIGDELFITRKTAGVHVTHILDKLGVSNRVEAAMAAARLGLLDEESAAGDGTDGPERRRA